MGCGRLIILRVVILIQSRPAIHDRPEPETPLNRTKSPTPPNRNGILPAELEKGLGTVVFWQPPPRPGWKVSLLGQMLLQVNLQRTILRGQQGGAMNIDYNKTGIRRDYAIKERGRLVVYVVDHRR